MEMDSAPINCTQRSNPSAALTKSASRLARNTACSVQGKDPPPHLSINDLVLPSSPKRGQSTPSGLSARSSTSSLPLRELLLLSPSPSRKPRVRPADRIEMAPEEAGAGGVEPAGARRRCKARGSQVGGLGCASPRNSRRLRKRLEVDIREERESVVGLGEEFGKPRKRRHGGGGGRSKKEKLALVPALPSSSYCPKADDCDGSNFDRLGATIYDLVMWEDVAKSSLWFGFGSLCFLSSCFAKGINFSMFSAISQLGLLLLGASFFSNSICQRNTNANERDGRLKDEDILRLGRLILPPANLAISKTRQLFSGEPSMTLKVIPFLLLGAEFGHLITFRRLCAVGFFASFTAPKLYSCYSDQITHKGTAKETTFNTLLKTQNAEFWRPGAPALARSLSQHRLSQPSGICPASKPEFSLVIYFNPDMGFLLLLEFPADGKITGFLFPAFIVLVILRCCRKHILPEMGDEAAAPVEAVQEDKEEAAVARVDAGAEGDAAEEDMELEEEQEEVLSMVVATEMSHK
ncbi:unnamed protein product [Linum tenue]|uniref:Reticulon-like protein n=1 Tax=Linum tenue TaxID=586396 RepID=A0AAV0HIZ6_9ROSI|nr:unnamed protein product [Linum tenue]